MSLLGTTALFLASALSFQGVPDQAVPESLAAPADTVPVPTDTVSTPADTVVVPSDTYGDPGVEAMILRAREARARDVEGIESYEALMRERIYVGLSALRFRRERGLFQQQRAARFRWERDGERAIQWLGARRTVPLVEGSEEANREISEELADELATEFQPGPLAFDPWDDRVVFGDSWAEHPLSDSAAIHYRYRSGDTLRVTLPGEQGAITMAEVLVEPRRQDVHLLAGSLWFDVETGALVRASYRPARAFDLEIDEPEDAEDVPGIFKPIRVEIDYITIDYSLHEFRFWLPRRFGIEGEAQIGRLFRVPLTLEWTVGQYMVNEAVSEIPLAGELPPGWTRSERMIRDDGEPRFVTILVPPRDSLEQSSVLLPEELGTTPVAFTESELRDLRRELDGLLPGPDRIQGRFAYGFRDGMLRYNRVEALSAGLGAEFDLTSRTTLGGSARIGFDLEPNGELFIRRGGSDRQFGFGIYRRLNYVNEREDPFTLGASALSLGVGYENAQFYRSWGAEGTLSSEGRRSRRFLTLFAERQTPAEKHTDFYLTGLISGSPFPENIRAKDADILGGRVGMDWQVGLDPRSLIASGSIRLEGGYGSFPGASADCIPEACEETDSFDYQRVWGSVALTHPLFWGLAGALEVGAGALWGPTLPQRDFYLGGYSTLRGFSAGHQQIYGSGAWMARLEVANDLPVARISVFSDAGWAGPREDFAFDDPYVDVGIGASLLDGIVRFDVARGVRVPGSSTVPKEWRVHFYLDGLF